MIYVTHDQIEAMSMGDRIVVMKDGLVQQIDTPLNIYHSPANKFVAGFIGSPTMNFISGTISENGTMEFRQEGTGFGITIPEPFASKLKPNVDKRITLGIRPEHIHSVRPSETESVASFDAQIDVVEPVGNEVFVYFTTGSKEQYVARLATDNPPEIGTTCNLLLDTSKIHFFDSDSEATL